MNEMYLTFDKINFLNVDSLTKCKKDVRVFEPNQKFSVYLSLHLSDLK